MKKEVGGGCIVGYSSEAEAAVGCYIAVGCKWVVAVECIEVAVDGIQGVAAAVAVVDDVVQGVVAAVEVQCSSYWTEDETASQTHTAPPRVTDDWEGAGLAGGLEGDVEVQVLVDAGPWQDQLPAGASAWPAAAAGSSAAKRPQGRRSDPGGHVRGRRGVAGRGS